MTTTQIVYGAAVVATWVFLVKRGGGWSNPMGLLLAGLLWPGTVAVLGLVGFKVRVLGRPVDFDGPEFEVITVLGLLVAVVATSVWWWQT